MNFLYAVQLAHDYTLYVVATDLPSMYTYLTETEEYLPEDINEIKCLGTVLVGKVDQS